MTEAEKVASAKSEHAKKHYAPVANVRTVSWVCAIGFIVGEPCTSGREGSSRSFPVPISDVPGDCAFFVVDSGAATAKLDT